MTSRTRRTHGERARGEDKAGECRHPADSHEQSAQKVHAREHQHDEQQIRELCERRLDARRKIWPIRQRHRAETDWKELRKKHLPSHVERRHRERHTEDDVEDRDARRDRDDGKQHEGQMKRGREPRVPAGIDGPAQGDGRPRRHRHQDDAQPDRPLQVEDLDEGHGQDWQGDDDTEDYGCQQDTASQGGRQLVVPEQEAERQHDRKDRGGGESREPDRR